MRWTLVAIMVAATVASDLLQSFEMKRAGEHTVGPRLLKTIVQRRYLILSIACLAVSFFTFMRLVQVEPLSFAVPASAASLILETIAAKVILREHVGLRRAGGALIVLVGVVLVGQ